MLTINKYYCLIILSLSCGSRAYEENRFEINLEAKKIFSNIIMHDSAVFENENGDKRYFYCLQLDSSISNFKGGILAPRPFKIVNCILKDSIKNKVFFGETFINIYPDSNESSFYIGIGFISTGFDFKDGKRLQKPDKKSLINEESRFLILNDTFVGLRHITDPMNLKSIYLDSLNGIQRLISYDDQVWNRIYPYKE